MMSHWDCSSTKSEAMRRQILGICLMTMALSNTNLSESKCEYQAIFNFGDSNSDTGGFWAAFPAQSGPFGMTFFKRPTGRASDGRLIVDFLAEALGFPFLSPYLQSIGSDYRHGANFATLASTVLLPNTSLFVTGISPFSLAIQLNQMKEFKLKVDDLHSSRKKGIHHTSVSTLITPQNLLAFIYHSGSYNLPSPGVFRKAIYTLYIGQNDFTSDLAAIGISGVQQYLPQVVSQIVGTVKELYKLGGRAFLVLNLAPLGCYPALLVGLPHNSSDIDAFGCLISYNNAVVDYNKMLKQRLSETRKAVPNSSLVYVDIHAVLLELFRHPTAHGLRYGTRACCGHGGGAYNFDSQVYCGNSKVINGTRVTASACDDPYNYVSWDGIHATEAANKIITMAILNGSFSDPPFSFHRCHLHPID